MTRTSRNDQRIEDEVDCLINIVECLISLLRKFSSSIIENRDVPSLVPSIKQVLECFSLSITLLESDLNASRIETIVFENCGEFVPTLLGFSAIPISKDLLNTKNQSILCKMRVEALQTLSKFVSICEASDDSVDKRLSKICMESILENQGLEALLDMLQVDPMDSMRLAIAELLFIIVVKNPMGKLALMLQHAIPIFLQCLHRESNFKIRNFLCALLREFALVYPEELLKENMIGVATKLINLDSSSDVRALSAEILEILFKNDSRALQFLDDNSDLAHILSNRLLKDTNGDVLESVSKLLETLFCLKVSKFMRNFVDIGGFASFIRVIKNFPSRSASLAARALRYLIQNVDFDTCLGYKITTHFPSLSVLLKSVLKQQHPEKIPQNEHFIIAHKLLRVELALCLGIIFSKNPSSRRHVYNELKAFPVWMSTLRSAILKHLSLAELEYFSDVELIDASGVDLYQAFHKVSSQQEGPAIKFLFQKQEERFQEIDEENGELPGVSIQVDASLRSHLKTTSSEEQAGKIKLFIIIYAMHLVLTPPDTDEADHSQDEEYEQFESGSNHEESLKSTPRQQRDHTYDTHIGGSPKSHSATENTKSATQSPRIRELSMEIKKNLALNLSAFKSNESRNSTPRAKNSQTKKRPKKLPPKTVEQIRFEHGLFLPHLFSELHEEKVMNQPRPDPSPYRSLLYRKFQQSGKSASSSKLESPRMLLKMWDDDCVFESDLFFFEIPLEDFTLSSWNKVLKRLQKHEKNTKKNFITCPQARNGKGRRTFLQDMNKNILPRIREVLEEFVNLINHHGVEHIRITVYLWRGKNKQITSVHNENIVEVLSYVRDYIAKSQNTPESIDELENNHADQIDDALRIEMKNEQKYREKIQRERENMIRSEIDVDPDYDEDDDESVTKLFFKNTYTPQKVHSVYRDNVHNSNALPIGKDIEIEDYETQPEVDTEESRQLAELEAHVKLLEEKQRRGYSAQELSYPHDSTNEEQQLQESQDAETEPEANNEIGSPTVFENEIQHELNGQESTLLVETEETDETIEIDHTSKLQETPNGVDFELENDISEESSKELGNNLQPEAPIDSSVVSKEELINSSEERPTSIEFTNNTLSNTDTVPEANYLSGQEMETHESSQSEIEIQQSVSPPSSHNSNDQSIRERIKARKERRKKETSDEENNESSSPRSNSPREPLSTSDRVRERLAKRRQQSTSLENETQSSNDSKSSIRDRVRDRLAARRAAS